jgi:hypothetical protein
MFGNKLPFWITISCDIKFGTVEAIKSRNHKVLLAAIKYVRRIYAIRGFKVTHGDVDDELYRKQVHASSCGVQ